MQQPETLSELSRYRTETESEAPSTFSEKEKVADLGPSDEMSVGSVPAQAAHSQSMRTTRPTENMIEQANNAKDVPHVDKEAEAVETILTSPSENKLLNSPSSPPTPPPDPKTPIVMVVESTVQDEHENVTVEYMKDKNAKRQTEQDLAVEPRSPEPTMPTPEALEAAPEEDMIATPSPRSAGPFEPEVEGYQVHQIDDSLPTVEEARPSAEISLITVKKEDQIGSDEKSGTNAKWQNRSLDDTSQNTDEMNEKKNR